MSWDGVAKFSEQKVQKQFYNEKGKPFKHCSDCKEELNTDYKIIKSYNRFNLNEKHRLIYELAICDKCREKFTDETSKETALKLKKLIKKHPNLGGTNINLTFLLGNEDCLNEKCVITNKMIDELKEYQVSAIFYGDKHITPMSVIGDEGIDEYQACFSEESQGYNDDFLNRIIDMPPELKKIIKNYSFTFL